MPSHKDIHQAYLDNDQARLNHSAINAVMNAHKLLKKTCVYENLDILKQLNEQLKGSLKRGGLSLNEIEERSNETSNIIDHMKSCYDGIADDLLLLAAFEHLMCSKLLKNGYVIHHYKKEASNKQIRNEKVSTQDIRNTATLDSFLDITVNGNTLLKNNYISLLTTNEEEITGLKSLKDRRNKSHFDSNIYSLREYPKEFFAAIGLIINSIDSMIE